MQYDGYGRGVQTKVNEGGLVDLITSSFYDGLGREYLRSNPYRTNEIPVYTTTAFDEAGRAEEVRFPDGAAQTVAYNGFQQTITEPGGSSSAGRQKQFSFDGLGRLASVAELGTQDPLAGIYTTAYGYNQLDKLVSVAQGVQSRCFYYDLLGRIVAAANPESSGLASCSPGVVPGSGVNRWEYDSRGNFLKSTQPSGKWKQNTGIDALNRVTQVTYSGSGTPAVNVSYDNCAQGLGRLCQVSNGLSSEALSYDLLGRVKGSMQSTPLASGGSAVAFPFQYEYALNGAMTRMVYPSGRETVTLVDKLGRASRLQGRTAAGGTLFDYVGSMRYTAFGGRELSVLGNGKKEQACFSNRLQVTAMRVGDVETSQCVRDGADWMRLGFDYGNNNNGNLASQLIEAKKDAGGFASMTQAYGYDGVNRLRQVSETGGAASWSMGFGYDRYGNQWTASVNPSFPLSTTSPTQLGQFNASTNRLSQYFDNTNVPVDAYDGDGNLRNFSGIGSAGVFDGENRLVGMTATSGAASFEYDGNGRRIRKNAGGSNTVYVYDAGGNLAAEYGGVNATGGRLFVSADHLGSTRLLTDASGGRVWCGDYLPFGEEIRTGTPAAGLAGSLRARNGMARRGWIEDVIVSGSEIVVGR